MEKFESGLSNEGILVSICIPTCNRCGLLRRTLRSLEGGRPDTEVLVFDNSDNDDSEKAVKEELERFRGPWLYHRNIPSTDPVENVNRCISTSSGKFIYILHDDDFLLPGGLSKILAKLREFPNENVLTFGVKVVDIQERVIHTEALRREERIPAKKALLYTLTNSSFIRMPSIVVNRNAYKKVGCWNPQSAPPDDIDMFVRLFMEFDLLRTASIVAAYTVHSGAWTHNMFNSSTIGILLDIFDRVARANLLSASELVTAKGRFFSQFILGGTYRSIRSWDTKQAKNVLDLFNLKELNGLGIPLKYQIIKSVFETVLFFAHMKEWIFQKPVKASG